MCVCVWGGGGGGGVLRTRRMQLQSPVEVKLVSENFG